MSINYSTLSCTTTYDSHKAVQHNITVQKTDRLAAESLTYPSASDPYETMVGVTNSMYLVIAQRVESTPVFVGNSDQITVTLTGNTDGLWYNKELTFTYQLPSNLQITSGGAGNGAYCEIYQDTNKLKCTYPAQAFQGGTAQIQVYTKGVTDGVVYPKISVTTDGSVSTLDHVSSSSITIIGGSNGGGTHQGDVPGTTGTGESSNTSLGNYTLTKTASTNYISKETNVTYTYVIKNNSTKDYVATPANAAPTDVLTDNKCANITFGSGWGMSDGHRIIAPGSSASLVCTMPVSSTTTNIATTSKNLTFASKSDDGTWNWNDATLKSTTAQNTVYYIDDPSVDPGTNDQQQDLNYITPGTAMPISCAVPKIWDAASMDVNTRKYTPDTYLYEMYQGATSFAYKPTSGLYTGPGAYWQYHLGYTGDGNPWEGSGTDAFKPVTNVNYSYNAIAYNKKDHLIYGFTNPDNNVRSGQLVSIDANGNIRRMGIYMPYPTWNPNLADGSTARLLLEQQFRQLQGGVAPWSSSHSPTGGLNSAFFDDDGNFYVSEGSMSGDGNLYKFDLKSGAMTKAISATLDSGMWASDYAYSNGYAYGIEQPWIRNPETGKLNGANNPHANMLAQVNLKTGEIRHFALPKTIEGNTMKINQVYDTAWTYGNGDIGLVPNGGGVWYHLHIDDPSSANPKIEMRVDDTAPQTYNADGTACADWPADLSIKKSQLTPKVTADGQVTWRIVVKNNGPGVSSGFNVHDTLPKGFTYVSATFPSDAKDDDGTPLPTTPASA